MKSNRTPALVMGSGVTALGTMRVLGRQGIPAMVLSADPGMLRGSRYYRSAPRLEGQSLLEYLDSFPQDRAVLLPCSDDWALQVSEVRGSELGARFKSSVPPPPVLKILLDKGLFAETLTSQSIPHPRTYSLSSVEDLARLSDLDGFFIKPRDSQTFFQRFGVKAIWPESTTELEEKVRDLCSEGLQLILQEYIPGPASNHYFVDGFVDRDGVQRAFFARRRLRMHPPKFGNSSYMVSLRNAEAAGALNLVSKVLEGIQYRGIFSAELKWDERDGMFKILEVNARPWWFVEFAARCGVDVVRLAYADALGEPVDDPPEHAIGTYLIHPYFDWSACLREGNPRWRNLWTFLRSLWGAEKPVFWWRDPVPALLAGLRLAQGFVGRRGMGKVGG